MSASGVAARLVYTSHTSSHRVHFISQTVANSLTELILQEEVKEGTLSYACGIHDRQFLIIENLARNHAKQADLRRLHSI